MKYANKFGRIISMDSIELWLLLGVILFSIIANAIESYGNNVINAPTTRRLQALKAAKMYLSPYQNIWRNLKLSNKHCSLELTRDQIIIAKEKDDISGVNREFIIVDTEVYSFDELWNMFCQSFSSFKTYNGLVHDAKLFKARISEILPKITVDKTYSQAQEEKKIPLKPIEKLDVNNCSEIELTALPGINIVMAKKLIKKREEIGGFKKIDDVFLFLHLKEHMINQLRILICVNKMKGSLNLKRFSERQVDL